MATKTKETANQEKESTIPDQVKSFEISIDIGSTRTRTIVRGLDKEHPEDKDAKIVYTAEPIVVSSEVGIVPKDDMAAKMAITGSASTLKRTYNSLTVVGDDIAAFRDALLVAHPTKSGQIPEASMTALERLVDDVSEPWVALKKPILIAVGVPTSFANDYKTTIEESILPRTINRNGRADNPYLLAAEAFFEARAIREMGKGVMIDDKAVDLRKPFIVSVGGATINLYIADTRVPNGLPDTKNSDVVPYGGRALAASFMDKVLKENPGATMDIAYAEKLVSGELKGYEQVHAAISGLDKGEAPRVFAPIYIGTHKRDRDVGAAMDASVRELYNQMFTPIVNLYALYKSDKPYVFVLTGRAGQIPGLDKTLQDGLHRANIENARVYNLSAFKKDGKDIFDPNLLVAQGGLSAAMFAKNDPDHQWDYLTLRK